MSARRSILCLLAAVLLLHAPGLTYPLQVDEAFWLQHRFHGAGEFLRAFGELDVQNWYRPLSNRLLPSLLYPVAGLSAFVYHLAALLVFAACATGVLLLMRRLLEPLPALLAALFFAVHPVQAFTAFGVAFLPDLMATLGAVLAALFLLRGARPGWPLVLVALALLSKESAVVAPLLVLVSLAAVAARSRRDWRKPALAMCVLAGAYLFFFASLHGFQWRVGPAGYTTGVASGVLANFRDAVAWTLPWETGGDRLFGPPSVAVKTLVATFWVLVSTGLVLSLGDAGARRRTLAGAAWFLLALAPVLPLGSITPYYLCLPLVGAALLVGQGTQGLAGVLKSRRQVVTVAGLAAGLLLAAGPTLDLERERQPLLGVSAAVVGQAIQRFPQLVAAPPRDSTILLIDHTEPGRDLAWHYSRGELLELIYNRPLDVRFTSLGETVRGAAALYAAVQDTGGNLVEVTEAFRSDPSSLLLSADELEFGPPVAGLLSVEPARIRAAFESYRLRVAGGAGRRARILFTLDDGPVGTLDVQLDDRGEVSYTAGPQTATGRYEFIGVRLEGEPLWTPTQATLEVRD